MEQTIRVSGLLMANVVLNREGHPCESAAFKPAGHGAVYMNATTSPAVPLHRDLDAALPGADKARAFEEGVTCLLRGHLGTEANTARRNTLWRKLPSAILQFEVGVDIDRTLATQHVYHHNKARAQYLDLGRCERSVLTMISHGVCKRVTEHHGRATLNGNEEVWIRSAFYAVAAYPKFLCEEVRSLMPDLVAVAYPTPRLVGPSFVTFFPDRARRLGRQVTVWAPVLPASYAHLKFVTPGGNVTLPSSQLVA